jgi:hypothetical protein
LSLPPSAILAIMNCEGQGVASSISSRRGGGGAGAVAAGSSSGMDPTMMNVWGDFMSEEMDDAAPQPAVAATAASATSSSYEPAASTTASSSSTTMTSGPRNYILPIQPRMRLNVDGKKPNKKNGSSSNGEDNTADGYYDVPQPGLLAQTGTLDSSV